MSFIVRGASTSSRRLFSAASPFRSTSSSSSSSSSSVPVPAPLPEGTKAVAERPEGSVVQAGVVSGAPDELQNRPVVIYRPSPPSTQSAKATSHHWRIDWDILQGAGRWENPLMGWASSADYMQGTNVKFESKEAAIQFCERQGYEYTIREPKQAKFKPKSYSTNYLYSAKPLRLLTTK